MFGGWKTNTDAERREHQRRVNNELIDQNVCPQCYRKRIVFWCGDVCAVCYGHYTGYGAMIERYMVVKRGIERRLSQWRSRHKLPDDVDDIPF